MNRKIIFFSSILFFIVIITFLQRRISIYDMKFYYGKDGGIIARILSVWVMSGIFYSIMAQNKPFLYLILGLLIGVITTLITYIFTSFILGNLVYLDLIFQLASCFIFIKLFFSVEKYLNQKSTLN